MLRFLLLCGLVMALLAPRVALAAPAAPAPSAGLFGCALEVPGLSAEQRWMLAAYRQQDATLTLDGLPMVLHICSTELEERTARMRLDLMAEALPRLSDIAGLPYDGPAERWVLMLPDGALPEDVLGDFNSNSFSIRLSPSTKSTISEQWVAVHEAAHYLANGRNFSAREPWLIEGYAEYLTERAMADMGYSERMMPPDRACPRIALMEWETDMPYPFERCGYDVGGAVFREIAQRAGDSRFRAITRDLADSTGINSRRLLDELERRTATSYQDLFRQRVFPAEYDHTLDERARLWQQLDHVIAQANTLDVAMPAWPETELRAWEFDNVRGWLAAAAELLDATAAYSARCRSLGLACEKVWQAFAEASPPMIEWTNTVRARQSLLEAYAPLGALAGELRIGAPAPVVAGIAKGDPSVGPQIERALAVGHAGKALIGQCRMLGAACPTGWQAAWARGEYDAAEQSIGAYAELLEEARRVEASCGKDLQASCRKHWQPTIAAGDPQQTAGALKQLRSLLGAGAAADARCAALALRCTAWRTAFANGGFGSANSILGKLNAALAAVEQAGPQCAAIEQACQRIWNAEFEREPEKLVADLTALRNFARNAQLLANTCPPELGCAAMWQNALNRGSTLTEADALLRQLVANQQLFEQALAAQHQPAPSLSISRLLGTQPTFDTVARPIAAGELDQAAAQARELIALRARQQLEALLAVGAAISAGLLLLAALAWRVIARRARRAAPSKLSVSPAAPPDDLLAELLAQAARPPNTRGPQGT